MLGERLAQAHALGQRLGKAFFFGAQHALDVQAALAQLGVGRTHLLDQRLDQLEEKRLADAEFVPVAQRAADDPAQHVAAALVAGQHAVDDQESGGADVVGDHAQRGGLEVAGAGGSRGGGDQAAEQVDVVVAVHALHDGGDALEAHAGIHRGLGQRRERAVGGAVELHEHQVPDLDVAVAVLIR